LDLHLLGSTGGSEVIEVAVPPQLWIFCGKPTRRVIAHDAALNEHRSLGWARGRPRNHARSRHELRGVHEVQVEELLSKTSATSGFSHLHGIADAALE
jgi:hypothetical protein